jgi:hypothetical protein
MPMDRFLIAPTETGLQTDKRAWLINDDAWASLNNAYVFRGRLRKRFGSSYMGTGTTLTAQALGSRLGVIVGTSDSSTGNLSGTVPGAIFKIGQGFSVGASYFTVYQLGTPGTMLRNDGLVGVSTYNTTTGAFVILNAPKNTPVIFYPSEPVMGLCLYEINPINNQPAIAFDTQFSYTFTSGSWTRLPTAIWHGTNLNFFWTTNWDGITPDQVVLFASNFNAAATGTPGATDDPIWYYRATASPVWAPYSPTFTIFNAAGAFVQTARIVVAFKDRLLLLNTIEQTSGTNASFVNRCRFSHNGSPFSGTTSGSDFAPNAFLQLNTSYTSGAATATGDGGSFIDATTEEAIVSAEFIKDRLIVYFERSTWELAYTDNQIQPFLWQKINTELGSEAPNSTVPFDKVILTVGNTGVHACNGANVERVDNKIPDQIFQINTKNQGTTRVAGIRDYLVEMVYWSFPSVNENINDTYPNRVLVYNYKNGSWAFNDDCITVFGYFEQQQDQTWQQMTQQWFTANMTWNSGVLEAQSRQVIAGNQEGFVFLVQADTSYNAPVMQLTNVVQSGTGLLLTIIDHTLGVGDYIYIQSSDQTILVPNATGTSTFIFSIEQVIDSNTVFINPAFLVGTYTGGAFVARVSQINMLSKQWNPYVDKGRDVYLAKIDFNVLKTTSGAVTVDYYPSYTELSMLTEGTGTGTIMGNGVLDMFPYAIFYPLELEQTLLWHPVYFQAQGEAIQIYIYLSDAQMRSVPMAFSDFELQALVLHTQPTSTRLQ